MSERLDLSRIEQRGESYVFRIQPDFVQVAKVSDFLSEAIRAQASEDALRKRVGELAEALRDYGECKPDCERMCSEDRPCDCGFIKLVNSETNPGNDENDELP